MNEDDFWVWENEDDDPTDEASYKWVVWPTAVETGLRAGLVGDDLPPLMKQVKGEELRMTQVIQKKSRPVDGTPYAVIKGGTFTWKVLKTYQNDEAKKYARWFLATSSPYTFGSDELGDGYVEDVVFPLTNQLVEVDGREPTDEDQQWFSDLQKAIQEARSAKGEAVRIL